MDYKDFFSFTKQERRGIFVFLMLALTIILIAEYWPQSDDSEHIDISQFYMHPDSVSYDIDSEYGAKSELNPWNETATNDSKPNQKFRFDPNQISYDSLLLLGFSKYGAKSLTKYIAKGGKIRNLSKLKSIYGIDSLLVNQLEAFIQLPESKSEEYDNSTFENNKKITEPVAIEIIELNSADSLKILSIKGVGPVTTRNILYFRKRLGGFIDKNQLLELNIIPDTLFELIHHIVTVDPSDIVKININTADYKTFITHPYFTAN
ncbi:MAG: helix-hairpin-helix domain-containing protein, partial [Saprospiraceae bacterium]